MNESEWRALIKATIIAWTETLPGAYMSSGQVDDLTEALIDAIAREAVHA